MNYRFEAPQDLFSEDAQDPMDAAKERAEADIASEMIDCSRCKAKTFAPLSPGAPLCGKCWATAIIAGEI